MQRIGPQHVDPCEQAEVLATLSLIPGALPPREDPPADWDRFLLRKEGTLENPLPFFEPMRFAVVRSFDTRRLYLRPIFFIERVLEPEHRSMEVLETEAGPIHVHFVQDDTGTVGRVVAYSFVYALEPARSPFRAQLRDVLSRPLSNERRPLTLFLVSGAGPRRDSEPVKERARQWMIDAHEHFAAACRPS